MHTPVKPQTRSPWMVLLAMATCMLCAHAAQAATAADRSLKHAYRLLREPDTILTDGHNDLPWTIRSYEKAPGDLRAYDLRGRVTGQTDLPRLRRGTVGAQFWSVFVPAQGDTHFVRTQLEQIDLARRMIARYPESLRLATSADEILAARRAGRIASLLGMEGGHAIENSLGALRAFYALGVRYMTLTHNVHNDWADSATDTPPRHQGLSKFGEAVVREMNRLGMLVDLSHVSDETMADALRVSQAPVIFSHSSARALCDVPRNVPDEILRQVKVNGGIVMVAFVASLVDPESARTFAQASAEVRERARDKSAAESEAIADEVLGRMRLPAVSAAKVADHIEHVRDVAGIEHVGLGGDFDGATDTDFPKDLADVSMYPNLFAELIRRGWTDHDLKLLAGGNLIRALRQAEATATRLRAMPASLETLQ